MVYNSNELLRWERSVSAPVSLAQGEFEETHEMAGFSWSREISDIQALPGISVRKVSYTLSWKEGANQYTYNSQVFIKPK